MVLPTRHVLAPASASVKTLLYCLLTLLSIVFQSAGSAHIQGATEGSTYLRSPTLTSTLLDILSSLSALNAAVFSRASGLIADIIGSDPSIISYVHGSGLAQAILSILSAPLPPSCEVICEAPAILCALSISSQGLSALLRHNPFPSLFACLVHPAYVLPHSRAVLPPATPEAIGQRLEDLLQHHGSGGGGPSTTPGQRLRDAVLNAAVHSLNRLVLSDLFYAGVGEGKGREEGGGEVEASLERRRYFQYVGNAAYALAR
ncbi:hect-domain containing protein [Nannochloropsis gaditana]|uniref:Hect-domain containing protein n=1 Tax=Nannochloropsis gaditana TaxID=72520 RepID=W7U4G4_9STRA|nr:hect-domain containing protein [Nannochloropsis gaditana]